MITLEWFMSTEEYLGIKEAPSRRAAADELGASLVLDGSWPKAVVMCIDDHHADCLWSYLLTCYGINATTFYVP